MPHCPIAGGVVILGSVLRLHSKAPNSRPAGRADTAMGALLSCWRLQLEYAPSALHILLSEALEVRQEQRSTLRCLCRYHPTYYFPEWESGGCLEQNSLAGERGS